MSDRRPFVVAGVGAAAIGCYLFALGRAMNGASYEIWSALVLVPVLALISTPMIRRAAARHGEPDLVLLLAVALTLKLVGAYLRYLVAFEVYDGVADASTYHEFGVTVARSIRDGNWDLDIGRSATSTGFIRLFTGYVYAIIGSSKLGGFFVYSWLGFWGMYLMYRAFRIAFPEGDHRRYGLLLFFLPSMLFWPSSIGKEAFVTLTLGLGAYGAAKLFDHQRGAIPALAIGLWATAMVRSHMALLFFGALAVGFLLRRSRGRGPTAPAVKMAGVAILVIVGSFFVGRVETQFGVDGLSADNVGQVLDDTSEQTSQGGSSFEGSGARSVTDFPAAAVAVLFRPFPFEATNAQTLFASLEGVVLLGLVALSWRRFRSLPSLLIRVPYVALVTTYSIGFIVAFSTFGNFGILARQRVQLFPFALVLLALPLRRPDDRRAERPALRALALR
jgi:hypothetical protein